MIPCLPKQKLLQRQSYPFKWLRLQSGLRINPQFGSLVNAPVVGVTEWSFSGIVDFGGNQTLI